MSGVLSHRLWLFAWGAGALLGGALAFSLGAYGPSWGSALAFPVVSAIFAVGSWKEREGESITHLLRLTLGFSASFLAVSIPITLARLAELGDAAAGENGPAIAAELTRLRNEVVLRWSTIALALPIGISALWLRRTRS